MENQQQKAASIFMPCLWVTLKHLPVAGNNAELDGLIRQLWTSKKGFDFFSRKISDKHWVGS